MTGENGGILNTLKDRIVGGWGDSTDYINGTDYSLGFWKSVYSTPKIKSLIANDTFFGELGHPDAAYRTREILPDMVSHRVNNIRFRRNDGVDICHIDPITGDWVENISGIDYNNSTGTIIGDVDIFDTPIGKIFNTYYLAKANIGFSSRADGRTKEVTENGKRKRIPELATYSLKGIDAVINPSKRDARILDESAVDEELENALIYTINEADEQEKAIMEEFITHNIGNINSHIFDACFGNDVVTITKKQLMDIQNKIFDNPKEDIDNGITENLYLDDKERIAELIYGIVNSMKSNLEKQKSAQEISVITSTNDESESLRDEIKELNQTLEKSEKDFKGAVLENSVLKEQLDTALLYIVSKEYPSCKNTKEFIERLKKLEKLDFSKMRNIYNDLVFGSGVSLLGKAGKVSVEKQKVDTNPRLTNLIMGRKKY